MSELERITKKYLEAKASEDDVNEQIRALAKTRDVRRVVEKKKSYSEFFCVQNKVLREYRLAIGQHLKRLEEYSATQKAWQATLNDAQLWTKFYNDKYLAANKPTSANHLPEAILRLAIQFALDNGMNFSFQEKFILTVFFEKKQVWSLPTSVILSPAPTPAGPSVTSARPKPRRSTSTASSSKSKTTTAKSPCSRRQTCPPISSSSGHTFSVCTRAWTKCILLASIHHPPGDRWKNKPAHYFF